jgi:hypothetical protein
MKTFALIMAVMSFVINTIALIVPAFYQWTVKALTFRRFKKYSLLVDIEATVLLGCVFAVFVCPPYQVPLYGALGGTQIFWATTFSVQKGLSQKQLFRSFFSPIVICILIFINEYYQFDILQLLK